MAERNDKNKNSIHAGHRKRMRERFASDPHLDSFAEHEIMEMLLFYILTRKDTNAIAHELIDRFGSVRGVLDAPVESLKQVKDIGESGAVMIKLFGAIAAHAGVQKHENVTLRDLASFSEYVKSLFAQERTECFKVICITSNLRPGSVATISRGSTTSTPADMRELAKSVLNDAGENIILAHNHPDAPCRPSQEDIILTRKIMQYLSPFDISVLDHYIVGNDGVMSMRSCGFIHDMEC